MKVLARWVGMTEGQTYTVVIGLSIALVSAVLGIPPALRGSTAIPVAYPGPAVVSPPGVAPPISEDLPDPIGSVVPSFVDGRFAWGPSAGPLADRPSGATGEGDAALPIGAGGPVRQGWWSSTSKVGSGGSVHPALPPSLTAPDVPPGGLYVAGGPNGPSAYSALAYLVPHGASVRALTLLVAPNTITSPSAGVLACPLREETANFQPAEGGDLASAPAYDCTHGVRGVATPAGDKFTFDVGPLADRTGLAIAIVPVGQVDRIAFSRPGDGSLAVG